MPGVLGPGVRAGTGAEPPPQPSPASGGGKGDPASGLVLQNRSQPRGSRMVSPITVSTISPVITTAGPKAPGPAGELAML